MPLIMTQSLHKYKCDSTYQDSHVPRATVQSVTVQQQTTHTALQHKQLNNVIKKDTIKHAYFVSFLSSIKSHYVHTHSVDFKPCVQRVRALCFLIVHPKVQ
jgi:hypothetical protein